MNVSIKKCTVDNLTALHTISRDTFYQTFADYNTAEDMSAYLDTAFNESKLREELCAKGSSFFFLYVDESLAAYLKINEGEAQTDVKDADALEIERIYVLKGFQGLGLGSRLLEYAISSAHATDKKYIWLGVWENNEKALRFYKRNGFYKIGAHSFVVGSDKQTDYIMRKDL